LDDLKAQRHRRLTAAMAEAGIDVLAIAANPWRSDYLRYALDVTVVEGSAIALVERDGTTRLLLESAAEAERLGGEWTRSPSARAAESLGSFATKRIALAPRHALPYALARGPYRESIGPATTMLDRLMLYKLPAEAEAVARAAVLADEGYRVFCDAARVGRAEYELVADVEAFFRSRGCPENFMILGAGGVEVRGMHPPGERRIARGDMVTTELTPCPEGYYAQICRTLVVGEPNETQRRAFCVYLEALEAGLAAVRPGATMGDIARAENEVFRRHGLGDYVTSEYTRVRGHGVGLYVDGPAVLEDVTLALEPDMTLIVHPNTYHPEVGYMVLGDTVRVTANGCEVLCRTPRELICVAA
jgi:Xaa-Pro aminopeptidase